MISPKIIERVDKKILIQYCLNQSTYKFYEGIFLKKGIAAIETHHYKGLSKINKDYKNIYPWIAEKKKIKKINNVTMNVIKRYFKRDFILPIK